MTGPRGCRLGRALVVLAAIAVATIALSPRGVLRAAAASELDRVSVELGPQLDVEGDAPDLPGVRAVIAREEQDVVDLVLRILTSPPGAVPTVAPIETEVVLDERTSAVVCAPPPRPCGDRAPPTSI